jgi:hypothetical protein
MRGIQKQEFLLKTALDAANKSRHVEVKVN